MSNVHLLVLIHGMWGNPGHLAELSRIIQEVKSDNSDKPGSKDGLYLEVLVAKTNSDESTYDGIDWGGERIADEIDAKVLEIEGRGDHVVKFSVTGYSLGGLLARYVTGILYQRHFFDKVTPVNFTTFATPHIGLLRYRTLWSSISSTLGPWLLSRTGEQFFAVDKWSGSGLPLLQIMSDPNRIFYQALLLFPHKTIYANSINDRTVPYATAAIEPSDPFADHQYNGVEIEMDQKYPSLIKSWRPPVQNTVLRKKPTMFSKAWFQSFKPSRFLPPALQFKFPLNYIMYLLVPILIPVVLSLAIVRLGLSARSSRARIRLLESDEQGRETKLVHVFAKLEKDMETAIMDVINDPGEASPFSSGANSPVPVSGRTADGAIAQSKPPQQSGDEEEVPKSKLPSSASTTDSSPTPSDFSSTPSKSTSCTSSVASLLPGKCRSRKLKPAPEQPILTDAQLAMVKSLNTLPGLKKELAFLDEVRNAHAPIVCRDVKRFEFHKRGEGVIRHWADHFVL